MAYYFLTFLFGHPINDGEVNPPEATVSFSSLLKGHWTPDLLKMVQSNEMPTLSPVHSAVWSVFRSELYTKELLNSQNWIKGSKKILLFITAVALIGYWLYNIIYYIIYNI